MPRWPDTLPLPCVGGRSEDALQTPLISLFPTCTGSKFGHQSEGKAMTRSIHLSLDISRVVMKQADPEDACKSSSICFYCNEIYEFSQWTLTTTGWKSDPVSQQNIKTATKKVWCVSNSSSFQGRFLLVGVRGEATDLTFSVVFEVSRTVLDLGYKSPTGDRR